MQQTESLWSIMLAAARRLHLIALSVTLRDAIKDIEFAIITKYVDLFSVICNFTSE